jgi:hypothetical protein
VAVIDEAQMIFDPSRGWAWTQAIVGVPANELLIICSAYAVPAIENLLGLCGERCTVRHFERKQQVQLLPAAVPIASLKLGDAVVAFSRKDVLMLRDQVSDNGKSVSVIYGALPPEVRRREAERFATGQTEVLVATDAIGMGLNLPIRRVLFSTHDQVRRRGRPHAQTRARCTRSPAAPGATASTKKALPACWPRPNPAPGARCATCWRCSRARRGTSRRRWRPTGGTSRPSPASWASASCARCWACSSSS